MTDTIENPSEILLIPNRPVGIVGYGAYVPRYRLPATEVARVWSEGEAALPIKEKAVPGLDEDVATMSIGGLPRNAMALVAINPVANYGRFGWVLDPTLCGAKTGTSTLVAEALGAVPHIQARRRECPPVKLVREAMVAAVGFVGSGMANYALAIGMDTAQGRPGDALEYTAGAGGAAFVIGPAEKSMVTIDATYSYVTDTPDFWRRQ